jgi:hypothetical protein
MNGLLAAFAWVLAVFLALMAAVLVFGDEHDHMIPPRRGR